MVAISTLLLVSRESARFQARSRRDEQLHELDDRKAGVTGDAAHDAAVRTQARIEQGEVREQSVARH